MNDIASAIGIEQLKKLPIFITHRRQIHAWYDQFLNSLPWLQCPPAMPSSVQSSYYFYWIQVPAAVRDDLAHFLRQRDIYSTFRYPPLHKLKYYDANDTLTDAELAAESTLCLPLHQTLSEADVVRIVDAIHDFGKGL